MYTVKILSEARKNLQSLPKKFKKQIIDKIELLATEPSPLGVKVLKVSNRLHRIRSGDYRVVYQI